MMLKIGVIGITAVFLALLIKKEKSDLALLAKGLKLLQLDYLGGHGSRGYGRVSFSGFTTLKIDARTGEKTDCRELTRIFEGTKL